MFAMKTCRRLCSMGASINQRAAFLHQNVVVKPSPKALLEPSVAHGLRYRLATPADRELLRDGLEKYFYPEDPVTTSHYSGSAVTADDMESALGMIDTGLMILAVDEETGRLGGFAGSTIVTPDEPAKLLELASQVQTKKFADILRLLAHLSANTKVCERFGVDQAYHFCITSVNPEFRGKAIGVMLQKKHVQLAHAHGIRVFSVDCTGPFSAQGCERLGMKCVHTMKYTDFKDETGKVLFHGKENFTELKSYVMKV
ncbi:uncharacterized protein LOC129752118 [Uranotaenia lowii]|uniref:uncharacterized protein LOC129752118 n=1 Tax=Uranotaenia lowii TaxID=190385 RepID=UPI002478678D|nr:uncharacterized protein LOC129752118 [Uranotaenia lowii]